MKKSALLKAGVIGTILSGLCCFTPLLVIFLGLVGLSAWVNHLDSVLLPALIFFIGLTIFAILKKDNHTL